MKPAWQLTLTSVLAFVITSCITQPPGEGYVREKIPVEIESGKPVKIEISSLSGNGVNDIGIQCSPEVWNELTNGTKAITIRLKSSNKADTNIGGVDPGSGGTSFLGYIQNVHYLFYIGGRYRAKASVEITFANAPAGVTPAVIIVCKTPADTGP